MTNVFRQRKPGGKAGRPAADEGSSRRRIPEGLSFTVCPAADGWPLRRFAFAPEGTARGSLLFLGGRGDFVEKYLEAIGRWRSSGWNIDGFDWRGQGGSGRMLADPMICHLESFDPLLRDLARFVAEWNARTPGPHFAVAHSMGAHLLLRLLAEEEAQLDGAALLAPMAGIKAGPIPAAALGLAARAATAVRLAQRPLWRGDIGNASGRMTSCPDRQADKIWWKANRPEIASGPPSWGWLGAALRSVKQLNGTCLERTDVPLLIMASRRDPVVDVRALVRLAGRLPRAELHLLDGKGHELLRESDPLRLPVLAAIDRFFDRLAG